MMERWGNARAKAYFEANVPDNYQRPRDGAPVREVQRWIRDKYEFKRFLPTDGSEPPPVAKPTRAAPPVTRVRAEWWSPSLPPSLPSHGRCPKPSHAQDGSLRRIGCASAGQVQSRSSPLTMRRCSPSFPLRRHRGARRRFLARHQSRLPGLHLVPLLRCLSRRRRRAPLLSRTCSTSPSQRLRHRPQNLSQRSRASQVSLRQPSRNKERPSLSAPSPHKRRWTLPRQARQQLPAGRLLGKSRTRLLPGVRRLLQPHKAPGSTPSLSSSPSNHP